MRHVPHPSVEKQTNPSAGKSPEICEHAGRVGAEPKTRSQISSQQQSLFYTALTNNRLFRLIKESSNFIFFMSTKVYLHCKPGEVGNTERK